MNIFEFTSAQLVGKKIKVPNGYLHFSNNAKRTFCWNEKELRVRGATKVSSDEFVIVKAVFDEDSLNISISLQSEGEVYPDAIYFNFLDVDFNDNGPVEIRKGLLLDRDSIDIFKLSSGGCE
jgi:hypothetical protein